jgi:hypothetical protein
VPPTDLELLFYYYLCCSLSGVKNKVWWRSWRSHGGCYEEFPGCNILSVGVSYISEDHIASIYTVVEAIFTLIFIVTAVGTSNSKWRLLSCGIWWHAFW